MAEDSSELPDITRRTAIKLIGGAIVAATVGGCSGNGDKPLSKYPPQAPTPKPQEIKTQPTQEVKKVTMESKVGEILPEKDKMSFSAMIEEQKKLFSEQFQFNERVTASAKYEAIVRECALKLKFNANSFVTDSMTSLILVESSGDPKVINNSTGATGLCQLKLETANEAYQYITKEERKALGIPDKTKLVQTDLLDPKTNIAVSMQNLAIRFKLYPERSLAIWSYHLGDGNLINAIRTYLTDQKGYTKTFLDDFLESFDNTRIGQLITNNDINFVRLITNKAVIQCLRERKAFDDDTQYYVPRIAAARTFFP